MKLIAIDPGNSTGIATLQVGDKVGDTTPWTYELSGGLRSFVHCFEDLSKFDEIWMERFTINAETHKKTREMDALYIIGWVLGEAELLRIPVNLVHPGDHKKFSGVPKKDSKISRLGWSARSKDGHADDACSILLYGLTQSQPGVALDLMRGLIDD